MPNKGQSFPAEVYTDETIGKIFAQFGKSKTHKRNKALLMVYLRGQLRCNEALDLTVSNVDLDRGAITVLRGKGGKRRVVGIDRETCIVIKEWMLVRPDQGSVLFCSHKGTRLHDSYVRRFVKRIASKAGIKQRVHVHGCRHTGACKLADAGIDIRVISKQLGHSNLAITSRYLDHLGAGDVVDAVNGIVW